MSSSEMTRELEEMTVGSTAVWVREKLLALSKRLDATEARLGEVGSKPARSPDPSPAEEEAIKRGEPWAVDGSSPLPPPADGVRVPIIKAPPSPAPTGEIERIIEEEIINGGEFGMPDNIEHCKDVCRRVLARAGTATRWRDAEREKPPSEVGYYLVYVARIGRRSAIWNAFGDTKRGWQVDGCGEHMPQDRITHWMPLPDPPAAGRSAG